jgi:4-hydroxybenzoyl-CoA thioesterase
MIETGLDANHKSSSQPGFFRTEILIRFAHCDPAGIVFYPRYLEMFNNLVEDWFREGLSLPFPDLIKRGWGVPTAHLEVDFVATSFLGETIHAMLSVTRIGTSSVSLQILLCGSGGETRVRGEVVVVLTDAAQGHSQKIPDDLRSRICAFLCDPAAAPIHRPKRTTPL